MLMGYLLLYSKFSVVTLKEKKKGNFGRQSALPDKLSGKWFSFFFSPLISISWREVLSMTILIMVSEQNSPNGFV